MFTARKIYVQIFILKSQLAHMLICWSGMLCHISWQRPQLYYGKSLKSHTAHILILQHELMSGNCKQDETIVWAGLF
jgi:hypothetical protein